MKLQRYFFLLCILLLICFSPKVSSSETSDVPIFDNKKQAMDYWMEHKSGFENFKWDYKKSEDVCSPTYSESDKTQISIESNLAYLKMNHSYEELNHPWYSSIILPVIVISYVSILIYSFFNNTQFFILLLAPLPLAMGIGGP